MTMNPPLGCSIDDLDTPALCLDLDIMEANIAQIAAYCRQHGVAWRPHAKGHKTAAIARLEMAAGALGITCAKLAEAEVMADGGVTDLLIANMVVGPHKVARLVELRRRADPIVAVDDIAQVKPIGAAMAAAGLKCRLLIEVDIGLHRVGTPPGEPTLKLAQAIVQMPGVELAGIMGYEGHLLTISDTAEKEKQIHAALDLLVSTKQLLEKNGIACPIVSCAGTGSYRISATHKGITELQAGGAIVMDIFYRYKCQVPDLQYALTLITTIVSRPTPERAIIDAGRKAMNVEVDMPRVPGRDDIHVERLSAEHGQLKLDASAQGLKVGDRLQLVPGYADLTVALHNQFYAFRGGKLVNVIPVEGRGLLT